MATKEQIINEYLLGCSSYRSLAKKHGIGRTTILTWVWKYQGVVNATNAVKESSNLEYMKKVPAENLPEEFLKLQKQLAQERLHNKLLTAMIDIAEQELKIPIRKKYGTKQLKK